MVLRCVGRWASPSSAREGSTALTMEVEELQPATRECGTLVRMREASRDEMTIPGARWLHIPRRRMAGSHPRLALRQMAI